MPLQPGTRLGPYEITAAIGAGGMGEVYKATDTRLKRTVAIKVLPEHVASDPDLKQRFEREARSVAALNHPNICTLHDIGSQDGVDFLVLEYLDGETLAQRLKKGALPLDEALQIAIDIADALDKAHRQGIVHRDLKPGNIMLTKAGAARPGSPQAKLLDFGLAKLSTAAPDGPEAFSSAETRTRSLTQGAILGTPQYMSPEQLTGSEADGRTDIFALGVTLYEMLAGAKAFSGEDPASLTSAILRDDPRSLIDQHPLATPLLERTIMKCLAKDPDRRWQSAHDVGDELSWIRSDAPRDSTAVSHSAPPRGRRQVIVAAMGIFLAFVLGWAVSIPFRNAPAPLQTTRFSVGMPPGESVALGAYQSVAISPSGSHLVFVLAGALYVRPLNENRVVRIAGSEGLDPRGIAMSPDGEWVAFHSGSRGQLLKIELRGGRAAPICESDGFLGGSWGEDRRIVFARGDQGIFAVSENGGDVTQLVAVDATAGERAQNPQMLPGGEWVLFTLVTVAPGGQTARQVVAESRLTHDRQVLVESGTDGRYVPTGHLVYGSPPETGQPTGAVMAMAFDLERLAVSGVARSMVEDVGHQPINGALDFSVSGQGDLVYRPAAREASELVWVDSAGQEEPLGSPQKSYSYARVSPDSSRVAMSASDEDSDLFVWHLERQTIRQFTFDPARDGYVVWTHDSENIVFTSSRDGGASLWVRPADGSTQAARLLHHPTSRLNPNSISKDDNLLVYREITPERNNNLLMVGMDGAGVVTPLLVAEEHNELNGEVSPNGRWLAYQSDEDGVHKIYVRPFPRVQDGQWRASSGGGIHPLWHPEGSALLFLDPDGGVVSIDFEDGQVPVFGREQVIAELVDKAMAQPLSGRRYDMSKDGRLLMMRTVQQTDDPLAAVSRYDVVRNWFEELKTRVPVR